MPTPLGPVQVAVVEATNVFFAAAFYIPELSLLGLTQTANAAATTLASTGDPVAATAAGATAAQAVLAENVAILTGTLTRAATNIREASDPPAVDAPVDAPVAASAERSEVTEAPSTPPASTRTASTEAEATPPATGAGAQDDAQAPVPKADLGETPQGPVDQADARESAEDPGADD